MHVAQILGIEVRCDPREQSRGRLVHFQQQPTVYLRPESRAERRHWTVAHELGEYLIPRLVEYMDLDPEEIGSQVRESLADLFAITLLVPGHWFDVDCPTMDFDLLALKSVYRSASYEVIALRMLGLGPPALITIFDRGRLHRRESNLSYCPPPLHPTERRIQQRVHREGQSLFIHEHGFSVQAWPVHEDGWKREIFRTVMEMGAGE